MKIHIEVHEDIYRQPDAERLDNGDDLGRNVTWLRIPEDVRVGLHKLLGNMSLDRLKTMGLSHAEAIAVGNLWAALG